jgi:hypothetical protein
MGAGRRTRWRELSRGRQLLVVASGAVELVLTVVAARDLAARDRSQVRGPKAAWAPALAVQPFGPVAYLLVGRRR